MIKRFLLFLITLAIFPYISLYGANTNNRLANLISTGKDSTNSFLEFLDKRVSFSAEGHIQTIQGERLVTPAQIVYLPSGQIPQNVRYRVKYVVPFHGAYLLHLRNTVKITDSFSLLVRFVMEGQSFSSEYLDSDLNVMWSKLSGVYRFVFSGLSGNDTLYVRMGDLERCRSGEGIVLDEFEGEGYSARYSFGNFLLENAHIGKGINREDDIIYTSFSYKNRISLNLLTNYNASTAVFYDFPIVYKERPGEYYQIIPSMSFNFPMSSLSLLPLFSETHLFGEVAVLDDHRDKFRFDSDYSAFLVGIKSERRVDKNEYKLEFQYRHYGSEFNRVSVGRVGNQPFTQLSLDKRFNNWFNYLRATGNISGINVWCSFKQYLNSLWFLEGNIEFLETLGALDETHFLNEVGVGVEFGKNLFGDLFFTNKILNKYLTKCPVYIDGEYYRYIDTRQEPMFIQTKEVLWGLRMRFSF
ncbi:MAG: hypothetical protein MUO85_05160 [candidate division Zixibacteria bacterium]|nr:hypothetical protein [candidate division Zixibacteria bacterium]